MISSLTASELVLYFSAAFFTCPIIRIGPDELHINDPTFYDVCYVPNYKFVNYRPHYKFVSPMDTLMGLADRDPAAHKKRRGVLSRLFSRSHVQKLERNIQGHIARFEEILSTYAQTKDAKAMERGMCLSKLLRCLAIDIISEYLFSEGFDTLLEDPDNHLIKTLKRGARNVWFFNFFWPVHHLLIMLPQRILKVLVPKRLRGTADLEQFCADQVDELIHDPAKAQAKSTHTTIFQVLMEGGKDGSSPRPSRQALIGEAVTLTAAGLETTGSTLSSAVYYACLNPSVQEKLHDELVRAFPGVGEKSSDEIELAKCERLPYLTAVLKESLRISPGLPGRLPRVTPRGGTVCGTTHIPECTAVSMSIYLMHQNPSVYPNPKVFEPERWIETPNDPLREKYLVPFSKGSRSCLGLHLASAEIYLTLAVMFRRFKFTLHKDNELTADWVDNLLLDPQGELIVSVEE
ncbi:hypothetical protein TWF696_003245 [Orbilia brochopaga]|uniref:Cytochrome P450 n=1 Tax=Orbilia brochopaga TaxID=3140254 RepID=A0AAV9U238_9PEZI